MKKSAGSILLQKKTAVNIHFFASSTKNGKVQTRNEKDEEVEGWMDRLQCKQANTNGDDAMKRED